MLNTSVEAAPVIKIMAHRDVVLAESIEIQYQIEDGSWLSAKDVPVDAIRVYELNLLPKLQRTYLNDET